MKDSLNTILTGAVGMTATAVTEPALKMITENDVSTIGNILIQIGIAVVTLIKLLKKPKNEKTIKN